MNPASPTHHPAAPANTALPQVFTAQLQPGGQVFDAPADEPLLLAAQRRGITLASSCRNGTCRACIRQLVSGQVTYRIAWPGLSADEKQSGAILPCVAFPVSDVVIATYCEG